MTDFKRRFGWEAALWALNILALAGLALGATLPAPGVVSYALAHVVLYIVPGYLILRVLLRRARFDPATAVAYAVPLGCGALSVPLLLIDPAHRPDFSVMLLLHAGWQVVALALFLASAPATPTPPQRKEPHPLTPSPCHGEGEPEPPNRAALPLSTGWRGGRGVRYPQKPGGEGKRPVVLIYGLATVVVIGAVIYAFADFQLHDGVNLGGSDQNTLANNINWIYHHPTWPPPYYNINVYEGLNIHPRTMDGAWAYEQALIARIAGIEAYQTLEIYPVGPLLALAFLAFFALAYEVTRRVEVALLALLFRLLVLLVETGQIGYRTDIGAVYSDRVAWHIAEDKILAAYVFLPAVIALTLYLLDRAPAQREQPLWRRRLPWGALLLALAAIVGTHPLGFGHYLMIAGAYLLVRWLSNPSAASLRAALGVGVIALVLGALPLAQLLHAQTAFDTGIFDWAAMPLDQGGTWQLRVGADGAYILHPLHVGAPVFVVGIALGLLMGFQLKDDRTARYVFAATAVPMVLVFTPYLASTLGNIIMPHTLERLLWLLPIGLAIAAACWWVIDRLFEFEWRRLSHLRPLAAVLPLALALVLIAPTYQLTAARVFDLSLRPAWPERSTAESEDLVAALRPLAVYNDRILAPAEVNTYLYFTLSDARIYAFRSGYPELYALYQNPWWGEDALAVLQRLAPKFFIVENGSPQQTFARLQPARYTPIHQNARYTIYRSAGDWAGTPADRANTLVAKWTGALAEPVLKLYKLPIPSDDVNWARPALLYVQAFLQNPRDYRAMYGLAFVAAQTGHPDRAEALYRHLLARFPEDGNVRAALAGVLWAQERQSEAASVLLDMLDPATLRALLDVPYLNALSGEQLDAALDAWAQYPAFLAGPHPSRALAARLLAQRGDRARAVRVLEHIPPAYRTSGDLQLLGGLYLIAGDAARALQTYEADRGRSAAVAGLYHLLRGHLAMPAGDYAAARDAYRASIGASDAYPAAQVFLGRAYEALGEPDAALRAYQTAGFWGEVELMRFYAGQDPEAARAAYERAAAILKVSGIPPFPPDAPPLLVAPPDAGVSGRRAGIGIPGDTTLAGYAVLERTIDPDDATLRVVLDWLSYDLSAAGPWWQIKVIDPAANAAAGELSQAALTPAGALARWTFAVPVSAPDTGASPLDVYAVAVTPEHAAGYFTYPVGRVMPQAPPLPDEEPAVTTDYTFGGQVKLYGYTLFAQDDTLTVRLFWEAVTPPVDLTVFMHLRDGEDNLVAQLDVPPGPYPTGLWEAGARVMGEYDIALPGDIASGVYDLWVGLYEPVSLDRLPLDGGDMIRLEAPIP